MTADTPSNAVREDGDRSDASPDPDFDVPGDATVHECPRCGAPFARERHCDLHVGLAHADLTDGERERYVAAAEGERADLRSFQIKALGAIVLLYFGFLFVYAAAA